LFFSCEDKKDELPLDCAGVSGGTATVDNCEQCVGGDTGETACVEDCNGDFGGAATVDNCEQCVGGDTGETACVEDCNGDFGGTAELDNCDNCVGGNTGVEACTEDCNGDFGGTAVEDCAGECNGTSIDTDEDGLCDSFELVTDIDGNIYPNVLIGSQVLMEENLKVSHYRNGDPITEIVANGAWASYDDGHFSNLSDGVEIYGNLYNWAAVNDARGLCPDGFHVLTDEEWMVLEMELGMSEEAAASTLFRGTNEGSKLAGHSELWDDGDLINNSEFGLSNFNAVPCGNRHHDNGTHHQHRVSGDYWSSTDKDELKAWSRTLHFGLSSIFREAQDKRFGFSVRCLKD
jgi:uncharacterized protein (TIGR02145 family)